MGLLDNRKPNVKALAKLEDVEGLVEAATFQDLMPGRDGATVDRGVPIREEAILALGALGPEAGNGTVTGGLTDPADRVRVAAVRVLYAREEAGPLAEALSWLPADRGYARRLTLQALAELSRPDAARTLARALVQASGDDPIGDEELSVLEVLLDAAESANVKGEVIEELISALAHEHDVVADRAEYLLVELSPASVEGVIAELKAGRAASRAAVVLGRIKDIRAMEPLVEGLGHRDVRVRAECAAALGELRDPSAVDPLMRATHDTDHSVRAQAGLALDRLGAAAVIVGISHLLQPMIHEAVRSAAEAWRARSDGTAALTEGNESERSKEGLPPKRRPAAAANREPARGPATRKPAAAPAHRKPNRRSS